MINYIILSFCMRVWLVIRYTGCGGRLSGHYEAHQKRQQQHRPQPSPIRKRSRDRSWRTSHEDHCRGRGIFASKVQPDLSPALHSA